MKKTFLTPLFFLLALSATVAQAPKKTKIKIKQSTTASPARAVVADQAEKLKTETYRVIAPRYARESITEEDLSRHLHILASDEYEGRETGEKGQKMAAEYIANEFRTYGLTGPVTTSENPYYQTFELEKTSWSDVFIKAGNKDFTWLTDFYILGGQTNFQEANRAEVVFAGYGIDDRNYSDYTKLNVTGKTVIILSGEPVKADKKSIITGTAKPSVWATNWRQKAKTALDKGAAGIMIIDSETDSDFERTARRMKHHLSKSHMGFKQDTDPEPAAFFISPTVASHLLGISSTELKKYKDTVARTGKPATLKTKPAKNITIRAEKKTETVTTENVLGYLEGTDKKDELIVITAHYDHLGIIDGEIYNGADDDGSGTVAVLEMAEAFAQAKKDGFGPRRSILFMAVTGEEKGLLGSEYYTENPVFPLEQTITNLNIDMIGRTDEAHKDNKNYVYLIGSDKLSSELHQISEEVNEKYTQLELDYTYNDENDPNKFYYRSDHYNFAKRGIPVIFYFSGVHEDYHQPGDEVEKIMFDKTDKITDLVFLTAWELANRDERPKIDTKKK